MQSLPCRFAATTINAGAIALLLSLPSQSVDAEPPAESARVEHLEVLLVEHDVRYVLRTSGKGSTDCLRDNVERG